MKHNRKSVIRKTLHESVQVKKKIVENLSDKINLAADKVVESYSKKGALFFIGNGGSAADAQHLAAELEGKQYRNRQPLNAHAITNLSCITAIGNDTDFNDIFKRLIAAKITSKDVLIAISTSGNSENIIRGIKQAKENGAYVIGFTGASGGKMKDQVDLLLNIPSSDTARIQEGYMLIGHILCDIIERELFADYKKAIFIDRDGVITKDKGLNNLPETLEFIPGALEGLKVLQDQGYKLLIITNQAKIERGLYAEQTYNAFTQKLQEELKKQGINVDKTYLCPHDPATSQCQCRKPLPGMIDHGAYEHDIDLEKSWIIGDKKTDLEIAKHFDKINSIGVLTGEDSIEMLKSANPTAICADLVEAAQLIESHDRSKNLLSS